MATDYAVAPRMSWGMWVASCPGLRCGNAEKLGRCDDGTTGGLEAERFTCRTSHGGCGFTCQVDWPPNIEDLETLLLARPAMATRNWLPGETALDLLTENIAHGIAPQALES